MQNQQENKPQMLKSFKEVSSRVYTRQNNNALKAALALLVDVCTTAVNVTAPVLITYELRERFEAQREENSDSSKEYSLTIPDNNILTNGTFILASAAAAILIGKLLPTARNLLYNSIRANVQKELTFDMVKKAYDLELDHHLTERTSDFALALSKNYSSIDNLIPSFYQEILPFILDTLAVSAFLMYQYGWMGFAPLAVVISYVSIAYIVERTALNRRNQCTTESFAAYGQIIGSIDNYQIAHNYGNVEHELSSVDNALKRSEVQYRKTHRRDDMNGLALTLVNNLGIASEILLYAFFRPKFLIGPSDVMLYAYLLFYLSIKMDNLPSALSRFFTSLTDATKVVHHLERMPQVVEAPDAIELSRNAPLKIEFRNVSFQYHDKEILSNISFVIHPSSKVALVGQTGAGKSTIIKLLFRFYEPNSGEILINDINIERYQLSSLRQALSIVSQDSIIFPASIRENVRYADLNATNQDIETAAGYAGLLSDDISDNNAILNKDAGNRGGKLSGGERQRINIARSMIKGGGALILDEPTASLDGKTERQVQSTLDTITSSAQITTLLVTHRLNTVVNADMILYLHQGKIHQCGTFLELLHDRDIEENLFYETLKLQCEDLGIDINDLMHQKPEPVPANRNIASFWYQSVGRRESVIVELDEDYNDADARQPLLIQRDNH